MRGERTPLGASIWLLIASLAVFAALLVSSAPTASENPYELLAAGHAVPLRPKALDLQPQEIVPESVTEEYTVSMDDGFTIDGPLGSPGPQPTDAPFGVEVAVVTDPDAQTHPSIAGEPTGNVLYAAYTDQTTPTNRDVYVARSTNGGATWTAVLAAGAAYNEFDPRVVVHGSRVFVFFSMDDSGLPRGYRYGVSANQGQSWTVNAINFGNSAPFRDMRNADASSYNGQWLYVTYEMNCDVVGSCGANTQAFFTSMFDLNGAIVPPTIYFPFAINIWEPTIVSNSGLTMVVGDIDAGNPAIGGNPGDHDLVWLNTTTGQNTAGSWGQAFITGFFSTDRLRVDAFGYGPNFVFVYQFINAAQGFSNHVILDLYTQDSGANYTLDLIAGQAGTEYKDPAGFASLPIMHVTFFNGGNLGYAYSLDAATTWSAPYKVNTNVGTVQDAVRSNDVTYAGKVRVCWQDNRPGNMEIFCSGFSGWSFYIFDRSPRYGNLDLDAAPTAVAFARLWPVGDMHNVVAPTPDQVNPGTRYVFASWSDGVMTPAHSITVGAADTVLTANYNTEYFLDISASVGTVAPAPGWFASGAPVTISWTPPAPGPGERFTFNGWTGSGPGSYTGMSNPVGINMNGPITEIADAVREWQVTLDTAPTGLQLTIDGSNFATPQQVWWVAGSSHTVTAITPQQGVSPLERYVFSRWADGTLTPTRSITATAATTYTAQYNLEYQVAVTSSPVGRDVEVDGVRQATPLTFWWQQNSVHLLNAPSPQTVGADTRYLYTSWSDGGTQSHTVTATGPQTLTANFATEYRYAIDTAPTGLQISVDAQPAVAAPQTYWWAAGSSHTVNFPTPQSTGPDSRYVFFQWADGNTANPRSFTSGTTTPGAHTIRSNLEYRWQFQVAPANSGVVITVNGNPLPLPGEVWLRDGSTVTFSAPSIWPDPVNPAGVRYVWVRWSNFGPQSQSLSVGNPWIAVVDYRTEFFLTVSTPYGNKVGEGWYADGTSANAGVDTDIVPGGTGIRNVFVQWSGDATGTLFSQSNPITMNGPKTATAQWKTQYQLTVVSTYGTASQTNPSGWYDSGSAATVTVTPLVVSGPPETRYKFGGWSGGATGGATTGTSDPITMNAAKTATALWTTQYHVAIVTGQAGITPSCSPATDCWFDVSTSATVSIDQPGISTGPGTRIGFIRWTGDAAGTNYQASNAIFMDGPKTVTIDWQTQYQLTLQNADPDGDGTSDVTQPGSTDGWYVANTVATLTVSQRVTAASGDERWEFTQWGTDASGTALTTTVTMSAPRTASLTWQRQVLVVVLTNPAGVAVGTVDSQPALTGVWVDEGSTVTIAVGAEVSASGKTYKFNGWSGGAAGGASTTLVVNDPITVTANYREAGLFESPVVIGLLIVAIVAALLIAFLLLRRRKQEPAEPVPPQAGAPLVAGAAVPPPPSEAGGDTMECPSCGMTVPAAAGPCPICGTELSPPAAPVKDERIMKLEDAYKSGRISKEQYQANLRRLRGNT